MEDIAGTIIEINQLEELNIYISIYIYIYIYVYAYVYAYVYIYMQKAKK